MGCFNVACSISHMDILHGDKCYFLILKPYKYQDKTEGSVHCYPTDRYKLLCLPIIGEYDDYGKIEEVERTPHIEYLEKYFQMPIESLIEISSETRGVYDSYSEKYNQFIENKEIFKYGTKLEDIIFALKFTRLNENQYVILKSEDEYIIEVDDSRYIIYKNDDILYKANFYDTKDFFETFQKETGIYLNLKNSNIFKEVYDLSSCFVLKDFADKMFSKKEVFRNWYYKDIQDWEVTPGLIVKLGFNETKSGIYEAKKNGEKYQITFCNDSAVVNKKSIRKIKELQVLTNHDFDEEITEIDKNFDRLDFSGYNFGLGAKAKISFDRNDFSYYCERFYECSDIARLNTPFMKVYHSVYENWIFDNEYILGTKLLYIFSLTHNMLAPTCNASQEDESDNLLIMYQAATEFALERKRRWKEDF